MADGPLTAVDQLLAGLQRSPTVERRGRLVEVLGTTLKVTGIAPRVGDFCEVVEPSTGRVVPVEVVGIAGQATILTPLGDVRGLSVDAEVIVRSGADLVPWGEGLLGRIHRPDGDDWMGRAQHGSRRMEAASEASHPVR